MKTIVHVNQHIIKANRRDGTKLPVLTVKNYKETKYTHEVTFNGTVKFVYRPDAPLSCGAHVWAETEGEVVIAS
jgi:hypothetical protein